MDKETIRTEAQRQLAEPASGGFWSNTDYDNVINRAQDDFALRTKCLKTYAQFTSDADTAEYDISEASLPNFIDIAEIRFYSDASNYDTLVSCTRDELSFYQSQSVGYVGTPTYYCYEDRVIEFDCKPTDGKTVRVYFYKLPDALVGESDVSDIPTKFHPALVNFVCWKLAESDELDVERTAYFKNLYEMDIMRANSILRPAGTTYGGIKDDTEIGFYA